MAVYADRLDTPIGSVKVRRYYLVSGGMIVYGMLTVSPFAQWIQVQRPGRTTPSLLNRKNTADLIRQYRKHRWFSPAVS